MSRATNQSISVRRTRRAPIRSGLSNSGYTQARTRVGCDLVTLEEASARVKMGESELLDSLQKRNSKALVMGYGVWLVDMWDLVSEMGVEVAPSGVTIVEAGDEL